MTEEMMCGDNRFSVIAEAKKDLLKSTNIGDSPEEMAALDNILFRCWQMGWLERYDNSENAVVEEVKKTAIIYFKGHHRSKDMIKFAIDGARWKWLSGTEPLLLVYDETNKRFPIPESGKYRPHHDAENASAFQMGAYWAYDIMMEKKRHAVRV